MKEVLARLAIRTPRFRWVKHLRDLPHGTRVTPIRGHSALIPLKQGDGAILFWTFDEHPDRSRSVAFLRLTELEAEAVYAADPFKVGMLEPVRSSLKHTAAFAGRQYIDGSIKLNPLSIPRDGSESDLLEVLDEAVDRHAEEGVVAILPSAPLNLATC